MVVGGGLIGLRLGDYELRQLLGIGGMAEVYRGYDVVLQREVAVKVLAGSLANDRGYVERFRTEARRVAALNHPNIVPVYAAGEEHGSLYLVMPILNDSLRDLLDRERRVPFAEAAALTAQIASGLEAAHALGLIHRDVKPENILVDADGKALLTDFGIAREMARRESGDAATLSATGLPVGTPEYMAPEQLRGLPLDARTDVYALGMVLYELLSGVLPFAGGTPYDIAVNVITAPLPPASTHNPSIPPALDRVVLRALARDPADRYPSAAAFATALRRAVSAHGTLATAGFARSPVQSTLFQPAEEPGSGATTAGAAELGARPFGLSWRSRPVIAGALALVLLGGTLGGILFAQRLGPSGKTTAHTGHVLPAATSTATATPTATPTATAQAPLTPLTISPTPLLLTPEATDPKICTATQTIKNETSQEVGWSWQKPSVSAFHFQIDGASSVGWPANTTYASAGGQNRLVVSAECKMMPAYYVTVVDTLGTHYNFVLSVSAATATPTPPSDQ